MLVGNVASGPADSKEKLHRRLEARDGGRDGGQLTGAVSRGGLAGGDDGDDLQVDVEELMVMEASGFRCSTPTGPDKVGKDALHLLAVVSLVSPRQDVLKYSPVVRKRTRVSKAAYHSAHGP